jgi:hypothetical protein
VKKPSVKPETIQIHPVLKTNSMTSDLLFGASHAKRLGWIALC